MGSYCATPPFIMDETLGERTAPNESEIEVFASNPLSRSAAPERTIALDSVQDKRREEAKSGRRYFFGLHVDQENLSSGC
jgi:hypothetical protein